MSENCQLLCGVCKVGCFTIGKCICCSKDPPLPPAYNVICLGITNAGKSTLINTMTSENIDNIVPTVGFAIKDIRLPNVILKVKELGGAANIRKFWSHYYDNIDGVIFVVDGMCSHDQLEETKDEIHSALGHPKLKSIPWLLLCNKQDLEGACTDERALEELKLTEYVQQHVNVTVKSCSKTNRDNVLHCFQHFAIQLHNFYSLNEDCDNIL